VVSDPDLLVGVGAEIQFQRVPVLREVIELAAQGVVPGGTKRNLSFAEEFVSFDAAVADVQRLVLADAQTSGGLLLAVAPDRSEDLLRALQANGVPVFAEIGGKLPSTDYRVPFTSSSPNDLPASAAMCLPMASEAVAAGEGALRT